MYSKSQKLVAEALGTFGLVFFGCGTAIFTRNVACIALAFGLSILAAALTIGKISGAHLNPAVSFAMFLDGRMSLNDAIGYAIAQCCGGFAATCCHGILVACSEGLTFKTCDFGANGFGGLNFFGALIAEVILTAVFVTIVLSVTGSKEEHTQKNAGLFIGLALTFVHLAGIGMTGTSVNPARSLAPAIFAIGATEWSSLGQLWVFIVGPLLGAFVAALIYGSVIKDKKAN